MGGADLPQVVTGRWLQLANHLNMPEAPGDEPDRHLCACALHLALYSQRVEAGSEAHKKLFDKRVIDALAGFSSDSPEGHLDLLLQIEDIWFRNGSEDGLSFRTKTGTYRRHGWVDGTSIKIDAPSFDSIMMEHILVRRRKFSPLDTIANEHTGVEATAESRTSVTKYNQPRPRPEQKAASQSI